MRFVAYRECRSAGRRGLRARGHQVIYVVEREPGIDDDAVLAWSVGTKAVLVTADKDFGEMVFRQRRASAGVLLLRLAGVQPASKAALVGHVVEELQPVPQGLSPC